MEAWMLFLVLLAVSAAVHLHGKSKAGPRQVSEAALERARPLTRVTAEDPRHGWSDLGSRTSAHGLSLLFEADDDPQAEATLFVPGKEGSKGGLANKLTISLSDSFQTHHVHTAGYAFRVSVRGHGAVVGKQTQISMIVDRAGKAVGGGVENDDDTDAAVGDWIEFESAEILKVPAKAR